MISTTALLGFAVLAVRKLPETAQEYWKPTAKDAQELSESLKNFAAKEINGKKQYPFEQYMESKDVVSFGSFGQIQVKNPLMYDRMNQIESLRSWIADKDMEAIFQAFPEERAIHQAKIKKLMSSVSRISTTV